MRRSQERYQKTWVYITVTGVTQTLSGDNDTCLKVELEVVLTLQSEVIVVVMVRW